MPTKLDLLQKQALPLSAKVTMTQARIREWYEHWDGNVIVSYSGGKDSTVLAHLVHEFYPEVPLVFVNTGLEFPEIQSFAKKMGAEFIRPKLTFSEVISQYGYPIISKENAETINGSRSIKNGSKGPRKGTGIPKSNPDGTWLNWRRKALHGIPPFDKGMYNKQKWLPLARDTSFKISHLCCNVMKKAPLHNYEKQHGVYPIIGTLTEESHLREQSWLTYGCNAYESKDKQSKPMSFWTEQDVLNYIRLNHLEIASVYGDIITTGPDGESVTAVDDLGYFKNDGDWVDGLQDCSHRCSKCNRTGCIFCGFGVHLEKDETRFQKLAKTHPRQYEYCLGGGQWVDNPAYDPTAPKMDDFWENWNPKKIWVPSKEGLGMKHVFDECNQIYGKDFIRYE